MDEELFGEVFDNFGEPSSKKKERILLKEKKTTPSPTIEGVVVSPKGKYFLVESILDKKIYKCVVSGSIQVEHPHKTLIAVGDNVRVALTQEKKDGETLGRIIFVDERRTFFLRKSIIGNTEDVIAVNMEQVLILLSASNPPYNKRMLDKILIACEYGGCTPLICINKMDIADSEVVQTDFSLYESLGYRVIYISAKTGEGIGEIQNSIKDKVTLFVGVSGVGKSTLVNRLFGKEIQKIGNLAKNLRGRHTTTFCIMLKLDDTTKIIDSPGFREFDLFGIEKENLQFYFPDFSRYFQKCKFQPCTHTHEPGCSVKNAVRRKKISQERYFSYLSLFESL